MIKGKHLNAWVEIRIADGSWRVLDTSVFMGKRSPKRDDAKLAPVRLPPERRDDTRPEEEQQPQEEPEAEQQQEQAEQDEPLPRWPLFLLIPASVALIPVAKGVRRRRRRSASPASAAYLGGWNELLDTARDLGVAVPSASTRPAQARALGVPTTLAREADIAVFTPSEPAPAEPFWDARRRRAQARRLGLAGLAQGARAAQPRVAVPPPLSLTVGGGPRSARPARPAWPAPPRRSAGRQPCHAAARAVRAPHVAARAGRGD